MRRCSSIIPQNLKHEIRNSKQIEMTETKNLKLYEASWAIIIIIPLWKRGIKGDFKNGCFLMINT
jgi:hypothetical protein